MEEKTGGGSSFSSPAGPSARAFCLAGFTEHIWVRAHAGLPRVWERPFSARQERNAPRDPDPGNAKIRANPDLLARASCSFCHTALPLR